MELKKCRWCNAKEKLVNSHIIPKCFYETQSNEYYREFNSNQYIKSSHSGKYDQIFCENCENRYSYIDNNAFLILNKNFNTISEENINQYIIHNTETNNYVQQIKKFLAYTLYKTYVSNYFLNMKLPKVQKRLIKRVLNTGCNFSEKEIIFNIRKMNNEDLKALIVFPVCTPCVDGNKNIYYSLMFSGYVFIISVQFSKIYKDILPTFFEKKLIFEKEDRAPEDMKQYVKKLLSTSKSAKFFF